LRLSQDCSTFWALRRASSFSIRQAYHPTINKNAEGAPKAAAQNGNGQPKIINAESALAKYAGTKVTSPQLASKILINRKLLRQ
jgi:hypothetical protein